MDTLVFIFKFFWEFLTSDPVRNLFVIVGAGIAIQSILTSRSLARKKQSADLLFQSRGDARLQGGYALILEYYKSQDKNIRSLALEENRGTEDASKLRFLLNHWELLSVGIRADIYDEGMVKNSWYSVVVDSYQKALPFIEASREVNKKSTLHQEFEWLAKRWIANPLPTKSTNGWRALWRW